MGNKKEEQIKIIEMMKDSRRELEARYARLKVLLGEEEAVDDADKAEAKASSKKSVKKSAANPSSEEKERIRKEMGTVQVQIDYVKAAIENCEIQLQKAKDKEEQKKIENVMKGVMLIGAYNEIKRQAVEKEKKEEIVDEVIKDYQTILHETANEIFAEKTFRYVTEDKIEDIVNNEEFKKMAEEDPNKLKRDEKDIRQEYENAMIRALSYINEEIGDDFRENEEKFKRFLSVVNGFETAYKILGDNKKYTHPDKKMRTYEVDKSKRYIKDLEEYGSEEDKAFFDEILEEIDDIAKETRELQNDFLIGRSNFIKGNGYTKELIDREKALLDKIKAYKEAKNKDMLDDSDNGRDPTKSVKMMSLALEFIFPIEQQYGRDVILQKNNELRQKMEMWYIYERLPKEGSSNIKKVTEKVDNEVKAWSKLQRMKRNAAGRGEIMTNLSDWAVENAAMLLARVKNPEPIDKNEEKVIKRYVAAIVMNKVVDEEEKKKLDGPESYLYKVRKSGRRESFEALLNQFVETKEFKNAVKKYLKNGDLRLNVINFLANDVENQFSKQFTGRGTEHRRLSMRVDGTAPVARSNKK